MATTKVATRAAVRLAESWRDRPRISRIKRIEGLASVSPSLIEGTMNREELIETMVTAVMEDFDFDKVHRVMVSLDWRWTIENGERTVPSSYRMMKTADRLLRDCAQHYGDKEFHACGTGGFMASLDNGTLALQFILTESTSDHRDYINVEDE